MPIHIEEFTSEVTVIDGDLPFSPQQIEQLVSLVEQRLQEKQQQARYLRESTAIRSTAEPPSGFEDSY